MNCPNCAKPARPGFNFCDACGSPLGGAAQPPAAQAPAPQPPATSPTEPPPGYPAQPPVFGGPPPGWTMQPGWTPPTGQSHLIPQPPPPAMPAQPPRDYDAVRRVVAAAMVVPLLFFCISAAAAVTTGGASSAETVVHQLVAAIGEEDLPAVASLISPDERAPIDGDAWEAFTARLEDLGLSEDTFGEMQEQWNEESGVELEDMEISDFLDAEVHTLETSSEELGDGAAKVYVEDLEIDFTVDYEAMFETVPQVTGGGGFYGPNEETFTVTEDDLEAPEMEGDDPFVVVVERDGDWYLSIIHTAFEYWQEAARLPDADFSTPDLSEAGAASADAAWEEMAAAIADLDIAGMIDHLDPNELGGAIWAYRDAIEETLTEQMSGTDPEDAEFVIEAEDEGDGVVSIQHLELVDEGTGDTFTLDGLCWVIGDDGDEEAGCLDDPDLTEDAHPIAVIAQQSFLDSFDAFELRSVEREGRWFVSLAETVNHLASTYLTGLSDDLFEISGLLLNPIEPAATLTLDEPSDLEFEAGDVVQLVEVEVVEGDEIRLCVDGDEPEHEPSGYFATETGIPLMPDYSSYDYDELVVVAPEDGMVRTLVFSSEPLDGSTVEVLVTTDEEC